MSRKTNDAAADLWSQIFEVLAADPGAAINDPLHDAAHDDEQMRKGLAAAGWSSEEIEKLADLHAKRAQNSPITSPGVNRHVEAQYAILCDDIEAAMARLKLASHANIARGVEPRIGPFASKINVISTNESIITVGSFLFRFCGLIARAFTRTLNLNPWLWDSATSNADDRAKLLRGSPELLLYWMKIYLSFAITGTHIAAPYKPSTKTEVVLMEQVARAMEIFAIAHEYGHHHLAHGRDYASDAHQEEYAADQFALRIGEEVERRADVFPNPYLSSGAGGVILLTALETLSAFEATLGKTEFYGNTHPSVADRVSRFDSVKVVFPAEFKLLKSFRAASTRIMSSVKEAALEMLGDCPEDVVSDLRALREKIQAETELQSRI
jgi:hypothetical protein